MPKPTSKGHVAYKIFDGVSEKAHKGKQKAFDALYLMLGDDIKAAIEQQRSVIELLELIEQVMSKMSNSQITAAYKLLSDELKDDES